MKIHKAILIKPADNLMVRVWDSEKPNNERDKYIAEPHHAGYSRHDWNVKVWLQSYKEYEVHPDYVNKMCLMAMKKLECDLPLNKHLKQGINLDPDLIEIKDTLTTDTNGTRMVNYAILKYKPVKSEDDVWWQLFTELDKWSRATKSSKDVSIKIAELKEKYTLKRK